MFKKLFIIIILTSGLLFINGCSSRLATAVRVDNNGKILVEEKVDQPTLEKIEDLSKKTYLAYQGFTKKDWGIVISYDLRVAISSLSAFDEDKTNLSFTYEMPGRILETNADKVEGEVAHLRLLSWESFEEDEIFARSREIRWWLIVFIGAAALIYLIYFFTKGK